LQSKAPPEWPRGMISAPPMRFTRVCRLDGTNEELKEQIRKHLGLPSDHEVTQDAQQSPEKPAKQKFGMLKESGVHKPFPILTAGPPRLLEGTVARAAAHRSHRQRVLSVIPYSACSAWSRCMLYAVCCILP
jgi:hypothetical protein